jgi:mRNA interferase MazF
LVRYKAVQGDLIWLDFDPQTGYEQRGRRPALIVSNNDANRFLDPMAIVCPVTSIDKRYPTRIKLDDRTKLNGFIMCEQMRAFDLIAGNAEFIEKLPSDLMHEVVDIVYSMIEITD